MDNKGVQRLGGGVNGNLFQDKSKFALKCSLKGLIKFGLLKSTESFGLLILEDIEILLNS